MLEKECFQSQSTKRIKTMVTANFKKQSKKNVNILSNIFIIYSFNIPCVLLLVSNQITLRHYIIF